MCGTSVFYLDARHFHGLSGVKKLVKKTPDTIRRKLQIISVCRTNRRNSGIILMPDNYTGPTGVPVGS